MHSPRPLQKPDPALQDIAHCAQGAWTTGARPFLRPAQTSPATLPRRLRVRAVSRDDADALLRLCDEHARHDAAHEAPGRIHDAPLELLEALFEPPVRAWAWIAIIDGEAIGYAGATAGCSLPQRGYYLRLESLYVRTEHPQAETAERRLFLQALRLARTLGCLDLQWRLRAAQAQRLQAQLPAGAVRTASVHYVWPLDG